jgi:hypothetical protein
MAAPAGRDSCVRVKVAVVVLVVVRSRSSWPRLPWPTPVPRPGTAPCHILGCSCATSLPRRRRLRPLPLVSIPHAQTFAVLRYRPPVLISIRLGRAQVASPSAASPTGPFHTRPTVRVLRLAVHAYRQGGGPLRKAPEESAILVAAACAAARQS